MFPQIRTEASFLAPTATPRILRLFPISLSQPYTPPGKRLFPLSWTQFLHIVHGFIGVSVHHRSRMQRQRMPGRRQDPISCSLCRKKKLRCNRQCPCSNCSARNVPCERDGQILVAPPQQDESGPDKGNAVMDRLRRLEELVIRMSEQLPMSSGGGSGKQPFNALSAAMSCTVLAESQHWRPPDMRLAATL